MCQYSSIDGVPNDWHLVHLGARATGGAGAVIVEASGVVPEGRISPDDSGHLVGRAGGGLPPHHGVPERAGCRAGHPDRARRPQGVRVRAVARQQAAHAGASAAGSRSGRAPLPYDDGWLVPRELDVAEIGDVVEAFAASARRAHAAGFRLLEIHAAHGYLLHEFLSPLSNRRSDAYGGDFAGRTRLLLEVVEAVRGSLAGRAPAGRAHLGQRLGRGRLVARGLGRARRAARPARRRPRRLLLGRQLAGAADPARPGLSGAVRRGDPRARRASRPPPSA